MLKIKLFEIINEKNTWKHKVFSSKWKNFTKIKK